MDKIVQTFKGFSGNQVYLMEGPRGLFVRKIGNISRNVERLTALNNLDFPVPEIYSHTNNTLDMEYIHGLDIKTYLKLNHPEKLTQFLIDTMRNVCHSGGLLKDYTVVYSNKLDEIDFAYLPFTSRELIDSLEPIWGQNYSYIGDFTLENIVYSEESGFILIDCATVEYDSWVFDIAKLRQDLELKWFLRDDDAMLDVKINYINQRLKSEFPSAYNDNMLILQLLRVYRHAAVGSLEHNFILEGINRLWK